MNTACEVVQPEVEVRPRYSIVKLDETGNWSPDIAARAGKVFGVYLFDANNRACGKSTPEYECLFVESQFDAAPHDHWLAVEISERDEQAEPVRYVPCDEIDPLPRIEEGDLMEGVIDLGIDNEEDALEYLRLRSV